PVLRAPKSKICEECGKQFPAKIVIAQKVHSLYSRRFCLECSPFGVHNTSRTPPGSMSLGQLSEHRRLRRNAKTYRYQKKRRGLFKRLVIDKLGGKCRDCGYTASTVALDPHHTDPTTKRFNISSFSGSTDRLLVEAEKCVLLCANCHRLRHAEGERNAKGGPVVEFRRRLKLRAVAYMGRRCHGCGRSGPPAIFDFHHRDPAEKDFGISEDGVPRPWDKVVAELAKCVMLCANCHREVHAGMRQIDDGLLGLAEDRGSYVLSRSAKVKSAA
ncbi:MAG: hypothetical protein KGQ88_08465, partial [Chloroflexi bacterium]|nr:hypothetical protein [Chloroflexota bacterium]